LVTGSVITKKKKTTTSVTFFDGFVVKKMATFAFFGGFAAKKVIVMSLPSSMVEHVKKAMAGNLFLVLMV
jgi:hypothetical protein